MFVETIAFTAWLRRAKPTNKPKRHGEPLAFSLRRRPPE